MQELLREKQMTAFNDALSSDAPAPGGGGAAGQEGAMGAALIAMVARLTLGRPKYAQEEAFAVDVIKRTDALRKRFEEAIDADAEVFFRFSDAMKLPKGTEAEKEARTARMQACLVDCTEVPLGVLTLCLEAAGLAEASVGRTNAGAVSDLGAAAAAISACAQTAYLNVLINVRSLHDAGYADAAGKKAETLLASVREVTEGTYGRVTELLKA